VGPFVPVSPSAQPGPPLKRRIALELEPLFTLSSLSFLEEKKVNKQHLAIQLQQFECDLNSALFSFNLDQQHFITSRSPWLHTFI